MKITIKKVAILLYFIMFIVSGFTKIFGFTKKTKFLQSLTGLPYQINALGMLGVILLEIIGSLIIIYYVWFNNINRKYVKYVNILFLLFLVVVTCLYHPPNKQLIPFLSNLTTFSGLLLIYVTL